MRKDYEEVFNGSGLREPPAGMADRILSAISHERRRMARVRLASFGALAVTALTGLIPAWHELFAEVSQSGFSKFISLIFSDAGAVAASWQNFAITVAESLPVFGISAVLASVFIFMLSVRFLARDAGIIFRKSDHVVL